MEKKGEYNTVSIEVDKTIRCVIPANVSMQVFHEVYEELLSSFPDCSKITVYYD